MSFRDLIERAVSADKVRRGCDKCTLDRSQYVPDHVVPDCEIALIGEAPGKNEVKQGRPFVGKAGKLARRALREEAIDPDGCSWMNVVGCRPPGNKTPSDKIIQLCGKKNLQPGLSALDPKVVVLLGASPFSFFFKKDELNRSRGNFRHSGKFTFMPTFHPAFVDHLGGVDSKQGRKVFNAIKRDLSKVKRYIDGTLYSDREYTLVKTVEDARRWSEFLLDKPLLSGDIECTSLRAWHPGATFLTIAFSWEPKKAVCFPIDHFEIEDEEFKAEVRRCVAKVLAAESVKTWHHAKFDVPWLQEKGWTVNGKIVCTMLIAYLLNENQKSYGLKQLSAIELDGYKDIVEGEFGKQPLDRLFYYNCEDADNGFRLLQVFKQRMDSRLWDVHDELLVPGSMALAAAERVGVRVDLGEVKRLQVELTAEMKVKIREANKLMPGGQTVTSPKDLRTHLFERLKLPVVSKTAKGTPQVDADTLKALRDDHGCELAGTVLDIRGLEKLTSTYLAPYPNLVEPDGRIHCSFTFTRTVTGRTASEKPNLQNIPRDPRIRNLVVSRPGWKFTYGDLSNAEMRVAASLSRDLKLVAAFRRDADVHVLTASQVLDILESEVTKKQRQDAKCVTGDTRVLTSDGWRLIADLVDHHQEDTFRDVDGVWVMSDDEVRRVTRAYYGGVKPVFEIKTKRGFRLRCTGEHRFVCVRNGSMIRIPLRELSIGDDVLLRCDTRVFGTSVEMPVVECEKRTCYKKWHMPETLTPKICRALGYLFSEGSISQVGYEIVLGVRGDSECVDDIKQCWAALFGGRGRAHSYTQVGYDVPVATFSCSSKDVKAWLVSQGMGIGAANKRVPEVIWGAPEWAQTEFLRAVFEGDGSVTSNGGVSITLKSEEGIRDLQLLLMNIGVLGRVYVEHHPRYGQFWALMILGLEGVQFRDHIGFVSLGKNQVLCERLEHRVFFKSSRVLSGVASCLRVLHQKVSGGRKEKVRLSLEEGIAFGNRTFDMFQECELDGTLLYLRQCRLWSDEIVSVVSCGDEEVFDLFEPEHQLFVTEGILTEDSINFGFLYGQHEKGFIGYAKSSYGVTFTLEQAEGFRRKYFEAYAGLPSWYKEVLEELYAHEQVRTEFGRLRRFPGLRQMDRMAQGECERMAINTKVQSVSADLALLIVIYAQQELVDRGMETRLILTVHDSVLCEGPPEEVPATARIIHDRVERFEGEFDWLVVPMRIDLGTGEKWASLEDLKPGVDF